MGWKELKQRIANGSADTTDKCAYYSPYIAGFVLAGTVCAKILVEAYKMATGTGGDMNSTLDTLVDNWELGTLAVGSLAGLGAGVGISLNEKRKETAHQVRVGVEQAAAEQRAQQQREADEHTADGTQKNAVKEAYMKEVKQAVGTGKDGVTAPNMENYEAKHLTIYPSPVADGHYFEVTWKKGDAISATRAKNKIRNAGNQLDGFTQDVLCDIIEGEKNIEDKWKYMLDGTTSATAYVQLRQSTNEAPLGVEDYKGTKTLMKETVKVVIDNGYGKYDTFYRVNADFTTDSTGKSTGATGMLVEEKEALKKSDAYKMEKGILNEYYGASRRSYHETAPADQGRRAYGQQITPAGAAPAGAAAAAPAGGSTPPTTTAVPASGMPPAPRTTP
jgi:hypothetical protein